VQQERDSSSSHAFFSSPDMEGEDDTGPIGTKADVRDFLEGAWAQIEAFRAQMGQHSDSKAGADRSIHGPIEGSSSDSDSQDIRRLDHTEDAEEVAERDRPVHLHRDEEKHAGN
jgi:hypothetical protein